MDYLDLITAIGLMLVLEGALYALFPNAMKRMAAEMLNASEQSIRVMAVIIAIIGVFIIWIVRA